MSSLRDIRCPGCHKLLCEEAIGIARLQFRCRHCRLRVVVVLTATRARIIAAA